MVSVSTSSVRAGSLSPTTLPGAPLGSDTQIAFADPATIAVTATLTVGVAVHLQRLIQSGSTSEYAKNQAALWKQLQAELKRLPGLSSELIHSVQQTFDTFSSRLAALKFSAPQGFNATQIGTLVTELQQRLGALLSPNTQSSAQPKSPVLSTAQQQQLQSVRGIAERLQQQAQAGRPLSVQQLAENKLGQQLSQLQQHASSLLQSRSDALSPYRAELRQMQTLALNHVAGLYLLSVHKALAGVPYSVQALKNLHTQARSVLKQPGDAALLQQLSERLQRREQPPPALRAPEQTVKHTRTPPGDPNQRALNERAKNLRLAAEEADRARRNMLPSGSPDKILKVVAAKYGVTVASLTQAVNALSASVGHGQPGGVRMGGSAAAASASQGASGGGRIATAAGAPQDPSGDGSVFGKNYASSPLTPWSAPPVPAGTTVPEAHRQQLQLWKTDLADHVKEGRLLPEQADIVYRFLVNLATRTDGAPRNPANTGNLRDLFNATLARTQSPVEAFAQVLADAHKVIPLPPNAALVPRFKNTKTGKLLSRMSELSSDPVIQMLVAHTAFAFGDPVSAQAMRAMIETMRPGLRGKELQRANATIILMMQHILSSSFIMSRAHGLEPQVEQLAIQAGYTPEQAADMQNFFTIGAEFKPEWEPLFHTHAGPAGQEFNSWKAAYRAAYQKLPEPLQRQLWLDTLTNFHSGTMASGKWYGIALRDAKAKLPEGSSVSVEQVLGELARIICQYQNEWIHLHGREMAEFNQANSPQLAKLGIVFDPVTGRPSFDPTKLTPEGRALVEPHVNPTASPSSTPTVTLQKALNAYVQQRVAELQTRQPGVDRAVLEEQAWKSLGTELKILREALSELNANPQLAQIMRQELASRAPDAKFTVVDVMRAYMNYQGYVLDDVKRAAYKVAQGTINEQLDETTQRVQAAILYLKGNGLWPVDRELVRIFAPELLTTPN